MRPILLLLTLLAAAHADWTITQKVEGGLNSGQLALRIKGDQARVDLSAQISVLTDLKTGDSVTLNHTARTSLRIAGSEAAKLRTTALGMKEGAALETPKLTPTGRKEKIGDYDCEAFTWGIGELKVTDWIAPGYPNYLAVLTALARFQNAGLAKAAQPLMPPLEEFHGMVVKREMQHRGIATTTTLLSVKEAPIDPNIFNAPKDYREQPAPQFPAAK